MYNFMYFLIIFLLVFFTLNPILKKFKKSKNIESIEHAKKFITENENIIKYSFYSDDIIYTILLLIMFVIYGFISFIFPTALAGYSLFNIYTYIMLFAFCFISIILSLNIRCSEVIIITDESVLHISGNKLKKKIYINAIKQVCSFKYIPPYFSDVLIFILKNYKIKFIDGFSNANEIVKDIQRRVIEKEKE